MRLFAILAALLCATPALAQRVQIDISGANFKPLPIAFPALKGTGDAAVLKEVDEALNSDLAASGIFEVLDRKGFLGADKEGMTASTIEFRHWLDVSAEALVKGAVVASGDEVKGEFRLFTVASGKEELKLNLSAPASNPRQLGHQVANALFKFFTHEPGVFTTRIAYVKKSRTGKDIAVADWDGHHEKLITSGGLNLLPAFSPDGRLIAFTSYRGGNPDLWIHDLQTGTTRPLVQKGKLTTGAAFSPDGKRIAFAMSEGEGSQLFVIGVDGGEPHKLTDGYGINSSPTWSPGGDRIAFVSNRAGSPQLYVMPAAGGAAARLSFQGNYNQTPDWSPRGDLIAFTARDERNVFDVFTIALEGGKVTRLTQDVGTYNEEPSFAPNGRHVAFTSSRNGGSDLYIAGIDGSNPRQLTHGESISTPAWGPLPK
jgi:TolB protein